MKALTLVLPIYCSNDYADVPDKVEVVITAKDRTWIKTCLKHLKILDAVSITRFDNVSKFLNICDYVEDIEFRNECTYLKVNDRVIEYKGLIKNTNDHWTANIDILELEELWKAAFCLEKTVPLLLNKSKSKEAKEVLCLRIAGKAPEVYTRIEY